jgi:myo-inositol-1(or 4)-monophosphatase
MHPMLNMAVKAARRAGSIITRASEDISVLTVNDKGYNDFVSEVDVASERAIIEVLSKAYPNHGFLGEESGLSKEAENIWIIDPLDGTTNFLHGYPQYSVSIALQHRGEITQAVVYDPNRNELFTATKGQGAYLNDRRIRVSKKRKMQDCLIGTGFPFRDFTHLACYLSTLEELIRETSGIRRPGSAALDLAYTAAGRFDAFFEIGLSKWDIAAGGLLITEAGGIVSDFRGRENWLDTGNIIASTPKIYEPLIDIIQKHLSAELKAQ